MNLNNMLSADLAIETSPMEKSPMFVKRTIVELNDSELVDVNGGSTPATPAAAVSMSLVYSVVQMGQWGYEFGQWLR